MSTLTGDHAACADLLKRSRSSFALPIRLLPKAKRQGTTALYAFCRRADDIVDDEPDPEASRAALDRLHADLDEALRGSLSGDPVLRAVVHTVRRFAVPVRHLHDVLEGVRMDLDRRAYDTVAELDTYCRRVASAVGLAAIHIWGFRSDEAFPAADACGLAFQLTNILRDIPEDLARGRIYLPTEHFSACGCSAADLRGGRIGAGFASLAALEVARAEALFDRARSLDRLLSTDGRMVFRAMYGVYRGLLDGVRRAGVGIFTHQVRPGRASLVGRGLAAVAFGTAKWRVLR